jgi:hypothetical protein
VCATLDGFSKVPNAFCVHQVVDVRHEHNAVSRGDPEECDEANRCCDVQKAFLYATWQPLTPLRLTPNAEFADDRWSDMSTTPVAAFPYVKTGGYALLNLDANYTVVRNTSLLRHTPLRERHAVVRDMS